jgi:anti-sigma B factor antagonist
MTIQVTYEGNRMTLALSGRLDTITTPQLETELKLSDDQINEVVLDLTGLCYLSSSGLRVIASLHKKLAGHGKMIIRNVQKPVMDVFDITGFSDVLTIL